MIKGDWEIKSVSSSAFEISFKFSVVRIIDILGLGRRHSNEIYETIASVFPNGWEVEKKNYIDIKISHTYIATCLSLVADHLEQDDKFVQELLEKAVEDLKDDTPEFREKVEKIAKDTFRSKFLKIDNWVEKYSCRIYLQFTTGDVLFLTELEDLHHKLGVKHHNVFFNPHRNYLYVRNLDIEG